MTIRIPKNPENLTSVHADRAIDDAWRQFERYETRIDFSAPQSVQDEIYRPYQRARELAVNVARYVHWRYREAEMLP
jgi:hypothetical protein